MFTALLDTCVLWPSIQRDFLLSLAVERLYRPVWSSAILRELEYVEVRKLTRRGFEAAAASQRARRLITSMRTEFDDAEVLGWEPLEGTYNLPDPDDEHLVAAAVVGGAGLIVTENIRDLPATKLPEHLQVQSPSEFVWNTVALSPTRALIAVEKMSVRRSDPAVTVDDILKHLTGKYGMFEAVELIRQADHPNDKP